MIGLGSVYGELEKMEEGEMVNQYRYTQYHFRSYSFFINVKSELERRTGTQNDLRWHP